MPAPAFAQKGATLGLKVAAALAFLAPLATRIVVGWAFYLTGSGKWAHFDNTVTFFAELGIPYPVANAAFVATTMVVALLTADRQRFLESLSTASEISPTDISAFVFLLFFAWLALYGPGPVSLDKLLAKWLKV